jgi:hypothetical protein
MRFEKSILVFGLATSLVAPACGSILQTPDGGTDGGGGRDGGPAAGPRDRQDNDLIVAPRQLKPSTALPRLECSWKLNHCLI